MEFDWSLQVSVINTCGDWSKVRKKAGERKNTKRRQDDGRVNNNTANIANLTVDGGNELVAAGKCTNANFLH